MSARTGAGQTVVPQRVGKLHAGEAADADRLVVVAFPLLVQKGLGGRVHNISNEIGVGR